MRVMDTPDVTRAQVVAVVQSGLAAAVAFGAPISEAQSVALLALAGALSAILVHGDATIRKARNQRAAAGEFATPAESNAPIGVDGEEPMPWAEG